MNGHVQQLCLSLPEGNIWACDQQGAARASNQEASERNTVTTETCTNHGKTVGKPWENHGKTVGKWWFDGIEWHFTLWSFLT